MKPVLHTQAEFIREKLPPDVVRTLKDSLDLDTCSVEDVKRLTGDPTFFGTAFKRCEGCHEVVRRWVTVGQSPEEESRTSDLCLRCVTEARFLLEGVRPELSSGDDLCPMCTGTGKHDLRPPNGEIGRSSTGGPSGTLTTTRIANAAMAALFSNSRRRGHSRRPSSASSPSYIRRS